MQHYSTTAPKQHETFEMQHANAPYTFKIGHFAQYILACWTDDADILPEELKLKVQTECKWILARVADVFAERLAKPQGEPSESQKIEWLIQHFASVAPKQSTVIEVQYKGSPYIFNVGTWMSNVRKRRLLPESILALQQSCAWAASSLCFR
jgi:hypothetical protein